METYRLTNETIDMLSEKLSEMYRNAGCTRKETVRAQLLLEEALLKYQSRLGEDIELYYRSYKLLGQQRFALKLRAPAFDPFTLEENPMAFMIKTLVAGLGNEMPTWKYKNLENEIVFTISRRAELSDLAKIGISIAAALMLGIVMRLIFPREALVKFIEDFVDPLSNTYAGVFCITAVLQTFLAIALSIIHIGNMASVGAFGGRLMRRFLLICTAAALLFTLPVLPFFGIGAAGNFTVAAKSVYDILISFIPVSLVAPFLDFNSVHIMIIGAMFGFSILAMGQRGATLSEIFDECNFVTVYTDSFLNRFVCIYAGLKLLGIVTTGDFRQLAGAGRMIAAIVSAELLLLLIFTARVCLGRKIPFRRLAKTAMPSFLICLSSANFGAAFSTIDESLSEAGVDWDLAKLSLNLGSVFFQPACTVVLTLSSLFMAHEFGVEISWGWVMTSILLSVVLTETMPNVPGASVSVITLLYAQLGIPGEALAIMLTVNAILQFITVPVDMWCLACETLIMDESKRSGTGRTFERSHNHAHI